MSIFKNPESCPNCVHKDVCMYKKDYAKFVADLEKDDRLLPAGVDFIEPLVVTCKYYSGLIDKILDKKLPITWYRQSDSREKISDIDQLSTEM